MVPMVSTYVCSATSSAKQVSWEAAARISAWIVALVALANLLCFILSTANPVLRSDDWYFLDAFVRKAVNGTLGFADFFVKRQGADHAQPLSKLVLLFEWRFLDLDVAFESIVGLAAAFVCALILRRFVMASRNGDGKNLVRELAWTATCVLLLSLNAAGVWTWPLVALGYLVLIPTLLFIWAAWHALRTGRYGILMVATAVLGVIGDDNGIIVVLAVLLGLLIVLFREPAYRGSAWKLYGVIVGCLVLVRVGYAFAPVEGGPPGASLATCLSRLISRLGQGEWWQWIAMPLALSVVHNNPYTWISAGAWAVIQLVIAAVLVAAHVAFWWRAFRGHHNLTTFAAVSLMLLSYAWLAGILIHRVAFYGTSYLNEERYVQLYAFNLIAMLLMAAGPSRDYMSLPRKHAIWLPAIGCILLIAVQVPLAQNAWAHRPYLIVYYRNLALKIEQLAKDPVHVGVCAPALPICDWSLDARSRGLRLLSSHGLNVFSPRVQRWHPYLPQTGGVSRGDLPAEP